jgi:hypothetical protein
LAGNHARIGVEPAAGRAADDDAHRFAFKEGFLSESR